MHPTPVLYYQVYIRTYSSPMYSSAMYPSSMMYYPQSMSYAQPMYYPQQMSYSSPMYSSSQMYNQQPSSASRSAAGRDTMTVTVGVFDNYFYPKSISVEPGTTVNWINLGRHTHTVTALDGKWGSGDIAPGGSYSGTFQRPGTYYFYCGHHTMDKMQGAVIVMGTGVSSGSSGSGSSGY
jgi:plastocyanin